MQALPPPTFPRRRIGCCTAFGRDKWAEFSKALLAPAAVVWPLASREESGRRQPPAGLAHKAVKCAKKFASFEGGRPAQYNSTLLKHLLHNNRGYQIDQVNLFDKRRIYVICSDFAEFPRPSKRVVRFAHQPYYYDLTVRLRFPPNSNFRRMCIVFRNISFTYQSHLPFSAPLYMQYEHCSYFIVCWRANSPASIFCLVTSGRQQARKSMHLDKSQSAST